MCGSSCLRLHSDPLPQFSPWGTLLASFRFHSFSQLVNVYHSPVRNQGPGCAARLQEHVIMWRMNMRETGWQQAESMQCHLCYYKGQTTTPVFLGFPDGSAGKESTCSVRDLGSIPGLGRSPGGGHGNPLPYSCLENSIDCIVHGVAKCQTRLSDFLFDFQRTFRGFLDGASGDRKKDPSC